MCVREQEAGALSEENQGPERQIHLPVLAHVIKVFTVNKYIADKEREMKPTMKIRYFIERTAKQ